MNTKDKISESQSRIIDALAACEGAIGELYMEFSLLTQISRAFWEGLAKEERQHAALLLTLKKNLAKGNIFFNLGNFSSEKLQALNAFIREELMAARDRITNNARSLSTAVTIETSLLESKFFDVVTSDAPEFKIIASQLDEDTRKHLEQIQNAIASLPHREPAPPLQRHK